MYKVIDISSSRRLQTKPFGKRYFYNPVHHSALADDVQGVMKNRPKNIKQKNDIGY